VSSFDRKLYVRSLPRSRSESLYLFVVNCSTARFERSIYVSPFGDKPLYTAFDWRRNVLYHSTKDSGRVLAIDLQTDSVIATLSFDGSTWGLAYDSRYDRLYVCSRSLWAVDCSTKQVVDSLPVLGENFATWDSMHNKLYTGSGFNTDGVRIIDCATFTIKGLVHTRINPTIEYTALSPTFSRLYLGNEADYYSGAIACGADTYTLLPAVGSVVNSPVCNDAEGKVYWPSDLPNYDSLTVLDMRDNALLRKVPLEWRGGLCQVFYGMALAPWSNRLYFTWGAHDSTGSFHTMLSAVDCSIDSVVGTVEVPMSPWGLYCNPHDQKVYYPCDSSVYVFRDEPVGAVEAPAEAAPTWTFSVGPNPASGRVRVSATVPAIGEVAVSVYDATGKLVRVLDITRVGPDRLEAVWDATDGSARVPAGIYVVRLTAGSAAQTRKLVIER
jgi:DNA-binding beta-propeller fold protein YncE